MPINKGLGGFCFLKSVKDEYNSIDKMLEDVENSVISRGGTCIQ